MTAMNGRPRKRAKYASRDGRRAARGLDDRRPARDPAVAQAVQEQRARQPMLQRAGGMHRLVLEVEVDAPLDRQREGVQMGVGRAIRVGLDAATASSAHALEPRRSRRARGASMRSSLPNRGGSHARGDHVLDSLGALEVPEDSREEVHPADREHGSIGRRRHGRRRVPSRRSAISPKKSPAPSVRSRRLSERPRTSRRPPLGAVARLPAITTEPARRSRRPRPARASRARSAAAGRTVPPRRRRVPPRAPTRSHRSGEARVADERDRRKQRTAESERPLIRIRSISAGSAPPEPGRGEHADVDDADTGPST